MAIYRKQVEILSGGTTSNAVDLKGGGNGDLAIAAIVCPGTVDAVTLAIHCSADNSTYKAVYGTDGNAKAITQAASAHIAVSPADYASVGDGYVKLVASGAVAADRTYTLIFRDA